VNSLPQFFEWSISLGDKMWWMLLGRIVDGKAHEALSFFCFGVWVGERGGELGRRWTYMYKSFMCRFSSRKSIRFHFGRRWWRFIGSTCLEKGFRMSQSKWVLIKKIGFPWANWCLRTWSEEQMKVGLLKRRKKVRMASCNYWTSTSLCTQITETCTRWSKKGEDFFWVE
jgi:hypothetical protein